MKDGGINILAAGMSLRDYFAAKALEAILSGGGLFSGLEADTRIPNAAYQAYRLADAMIAERDKDLTGVR